MDQAARELAYAAKLIREGNKWAEHTKKLTPLTQGQDVLIQCQHGQARGKWNRSGRIIEKIDRSSYWVRMDGSGRKTRRNRVHMRPMKQSSPAQQARVYIPPMEFEIDTGRHAPGEGEPAPCSESTAAPCGAQTSQETSNQEQMQESSQEQLQRPLGIEGAQ